MARQRKKLPGKTKLTVPLLCKEAIKFAEVESTYPEPTLYGVTDGKAVGTYLEHKLRAHLEAAYEFAPCNSASGIDFPDLNVDMKVTAISQPQSSCAFKSARQKIFGLGYSLLVFVYEKKDQPETSTAVLNILHTVFVEARRTADYTMTALIRKHLEAGCNAEDLIGLMHDKNLPVDDIEANQIAEELLGKPCEQGYYNLQRAAMAASIWADYRAGRENGWDYEAAINQGVQVGQGQNNRGIRRFPNAPWFGEASLRTVSGARP